MAVDNTNNNTNSLTNVSEVSPGDEITADTFQEMLDTLDALVSHNHTYTDDYTTNCECNCGRGKL